MKHAIRDIRRRALSCLDVVENQIKRGDTSGALAEIDHFHTWLHDHAERNISVKYMNDESVRGSNSVVGRIP